MPSEGLSVCGAFVVGFFANNTQEGDFLFVRATKTQYIAFIGGCGMTLLQIALLGAWFGNYLRFMQPQRVKLYGVGAK